MHNTEQKLERNWERREFPMLTNDAEQWKGQSSQVKWYRLAFRFLSKVGRFLKISLFNMHFYGFPAMAYKKHSLKFHESGKQLHLFYRSDDKFYENSNFLHYSSFKAYEFYKTIETFKSWHFSETNALNIFKKKQINYLIFICAKKHCTCFEFKLTFTFIHNTTAYLMESLDRNHWIVFKKNHSMCNSLYIHIELFANSMETRMRYLDSQQYSMRLNRRFHVHLETAVDRPIAGS